VGYRIPHPCVWEGKNNDQKKQRFFLQIKFLETSISWSEKRHLVLIGVHV
jgi:hypothetical protein